MKKVTQIAAKNDDCKSSGFDEFIDAVENSVSQIKFPESADNHVKWMNLLDKLESAEMFETYIVCTNLLGFCEDLNCYNFVKFLARDLSNYHQSETFLWVGKKYELKMLSTHLESLYIALEWMVAEVAEHLQL